MSEGTSESKGRVREMSLNGIIVGRWVPKLGNAFEHFEPLTEQPPEDVAAEVRKVESWLRERGEEGEFALIRQYSVHIKIAKIVKVTSETVKYP